MSGPASHSLPRTRTGGAAAPNTSICAFSRASARRQPPSRAFPLPSLDRTCHTCPTICRLHGRARARPGLMGEEVLQLRDPRLHRHPRPVPHQRLQPHPRPPPPPPPPHPPPPPPAHPPAPEEAAAVTRAGSPSRDPSPRVAHPQRLCEGPCPTGRRRAGRKVCASASAGKGRRRVGAAGKGGSSVVPRRVLRRRFPGTTLGDARCRPIHGDIVYLYTGAPNPLCTRPIHGQTSP